MTIEPKGNSTILVVEDDERERAVLAAMITSFGFQAETATDGYDALAKLESLTVAAVVTDLMMPRLDGFDLLRRMIDRGQMVPTIVLTNLGDMEQAVTIVHELQAFWFLEKPAKAEVLGTLLRRAVRYGELLKGTELLQRQLSQQGILGDMVGSSRQMQQIFTLIQRVAPTQASVMITGESGTGKEMVARAIHRLSRRNTGPFVAINCAAVPAELIESELFGHEKGSFTGAALRHLGCFEQANKGTLFLDEIGEMPLGMQARLLRALEESSVRRVGGSQEIPVDVRILAATNRMTEGHGAPEALREDLFYRLNVFQIALPPLRERKDDIPQIANALIASLNQKHNCAVTTLHPDALHRLLSHSWPGNVRELRNVLEWAVITARKDLILGHHLPRLGTAASDSARLAPKPSLNSLSSNGVLFEAGRTLDDINSEYIQLTLKSVNDDHKRAAELLGISTRTLYTRKAEAKRAVAGQI